MGILDSLKRARDLSNLRKQVRKAPSPAAYGALAERHVALGQVDEALEIAEQGLAKFPNSERLGQVCLFVKKKRYTGQIRKLQEDVKRRPSPLAYTQLADIYRELGDDEEALRIATECAERFPLNENPYLLQGEIRLERFLSDVIGKDAEIAETALKKVVRLNGHNVKAHLFLAELYYLVGALGDCRRHLRSVLTINPTEREVQNFIKNLDSPDSMDTGDGLEFKERAEQVEIEGAHANPPEFFPSVHPRKGATPTTQRSKVNMESLKASVVRLGDHQGVRNSIILDRDGEILADHTDPDSLSRRSFASLVTAISATADDASRRMDTGALVRAEIEGPAGNVTVARVRSVTIAILYEEPLRPDRVWELLQDFIARNLTGDREVIVA